MFDVYTCNKEIVVLDRLSCYTNNIIPILLKGTYARRELPKDCTTILYRKETFRTDMWSVIEQYETKRANQSLK